MERIIQKMITLIQEMVPLLRRMKNRINQKRLKNKSFSIIASNCNGGVMAHDLHQRFNSPFVNLWIHPKEYIQLLSDFDNYMEADLTFTEEAGINYPVGLLKDVRIYFEHYHSEEEARRKWNERKQRINKNNLFILFTDRDGCTYHDLELFDGLPYKNKVVFTKQKYPEIKSSFYIKGFENESSVGVCSEYKSAYSIKRYFDDFNYIKWLNGNGLS